MTPDTEELKRLAQEATPGPEWTGNPSNDAIVAFMLAAHPEAILALIERLETLEAELKGAVQLTLGQLLVAERVFKDWNSRTGVVNAPLPDWLAAAIKEAQGE